jgi:quinol monooxygenase YgiN
MIVEYIRYRVPEPRGAALIEAYAIAGESLKASPNCLGFDLSRCTESPEHFILRIQWDSAEGHMQGFRKSPQFPSFFAAIKPFLGDIEEMKHYDLTPVRWTR